MVAALAMPRHKVGFGAKVLTAGVFLKALLMTAVVSIVGATTFGQSIILVLVSASATGVFALLVVLIQVHSERALHQRIDRLEGKADRIEGQTSEAASKAQVIAEKTQAIAEGIAETVGPNGPGKGAA